MATETRRLPWSKLMILLSPPIFFLQGQLYHYGQLDAFGLPVSALPVGFQESWILAYEAYLRLLLTICQWGADKLYMLVTTFMFLTFVLVTSLVLLVALSKWLPRRWALLRLRRGARERFRISKHFRVLAIAWLRVVRAPILAGLSIPYLMLFIFLIGAPFFYAGRHSVEESRKSDFRDFAALEEIQQTAAGSMQRVFECRGDFCVLIRRDHAVLVSRGSLDNRVISGKAFRQK